VKGLGVRVPSLALRTAQKERRFARQPRARMTTRNASAHKLCRYILQVSIKL
jgi:hypothetical protein